MQNNRIATAIADLEEPVVPSTYGEGPLPGVIILAIFMAL